MRDPSRIEIRITLGARIMRVDTGRQFFAAWNRGIKNSQNAEVSSRVDNCRHGITSIHHVSPRRCGRGPTRDHVDSRFVRIQLNHMSAGIRRDPHDPAWPQGSRDPHDPCGSLLSCGDAGSCGSLLPCGILKKNKFGSKSTSRFPSCGSSS